MNAIQVTLLVIVAVEFLSVLELYFMQDRCIFNGIAMFKVCEAARQDPDLFGLVRYLTNWVARQDPDLFGLVRYLTNWVAGMKLIVIGLVAVIVFTAPDQTILLAALTMVITVASFFWRMFPAVRFFDKMGQIEPKGRSNVLGLMVMGLEVFLVASLLIEVFLA
jgi:hypothetical protein